MYDFIEVWRVRSYGFWFTQDALSHLATAMWTFFVPLIVLGATGSAAAAGGVLTLMSVAKIVVAIPGGTLVDRVNRVLIVWSRGCALATIWVIITLLSLFDVDRLSFILPLLVLAACVTGLTGTASNSLLRSIVPGSRLPQALANNQVRDSAIEITAAPIAGLLLTFGAPLILLVTGILDFLAGLTGRQIPRETVAVASSGKSFWGDLLYGFEWLWQHKVLIASAVIVSLANFALVGTIVGLQLQLALDGFDPASIGFLFIAPAIGMITGAVVASALVNRWPVGRVLPISLLGVAAAITALGVVPFAPIALAVPLASIGFILPLTNIGLVGWLAWVVPSELQGRVRAASGVIVGAGGALAPVIAGSIIGAGAGFQPYVFVAVAAILLAIGTAVGIPAIRGIGKPSSWDSQTPIAKTHNT